MRITWLQPCKRTEIVKSQFHFIFLVFLASLFSSSVWDSGSSLCGCCRFEAFLNLRWPSSFLLTLIHTVPMWNSHLLTSLSLTVGLASLAIVQVHCHCSTQHTSTLSQSCLRLHWLAAHVRLWPLRSVLPSGSEHGCLLVPIIWSELAEASRRKQDAD